MSLGSEIRQMRQKAFFTQDAFAKEIDVAVSTVNRWEMGKAKPNMKAMKSIKSFCQLNALDYDCIEKEWLNYGREEA